VIAQVEPETFPQGCARKRQYRTREDAARTAANMKARNRRHGIAKPYVRPYLCEPGCGWWHVTSQRLRTPSPVPDDGST